MALQQWRDARRGLREIHEASIKEWTTQHCFFANMGGIRLVTVNETNSARRRIWCDVNQILWLAKKKALPDGLRNLSKEKIEGRSKSDSFVKAVACLQVLWLVAQSCARVAQDLPLTTLELSTMAFILYALVNYSLWWNKPQDVTVPVDITISANIVSDRHFMALIYHNRRVLNYYPVAKSQEFYLSVLLPLSLWSLLFGGIHCAAWNFSFPSPTEQLLWKIAAVFATVSVPIFMLLHVATTVVYQFISDTEQIDSEVFGSVMLAILVPIYTISRLYLVVEVFIALRSLPPACYETVVWSKFLPHVS
jgi:hypothetical protein